MSDVSYNMESVNPEEIIRIIGMDNYQTVALDDHTIGLKPKWISVNDRLPPKDKPFLAYVLSGFHFQGSKDCRINDIVTCIWDDFREIFYEYCHCTGYEHDREFIEITHWMPLPEPPNK